MAITVKHKFVSAIPDSGDTTIVQPSNWNDTHDLVGTVPVANGGTGAATLTGYVKGNGTSNMTASSTIPNTDVTGLGTASTKDAGVANGVATLDGSGTVPISQLPAAVIGALSYQGTWNANTNTPTLVSSSGTKGYYYVVSVAGSTNLNGITDWQVGDWAVYNGSAWQKIDNTDAVTSVNGYTGTVVLTNTDISGFGTMSTQNANSVAITGGAIDGTTIGATTTSTGKFTTLNASTSLTTPIVQASNSGGLSLKNSAGTTQISMGGGGGDNVSINVATNINGTNAQIDISPTGTGHVHMKPTGTGSIEIAPTNVGTIDNMTIGATTPKAITGTTITATTFSGSGASLTSIPNSALVNSAITINGNSTALGGSVSVGTVTSVAATAGTGISISGSPITTSGTLTITNTAPDQTVAISSGTGISVTGTYPNFTVTNTSPSSGGTVTSVSGTAPISVATGTTTPAISISQATTSTNGYLSSTDWNTFNNKQPAGAYLTAVTADSPLSGSGTSASHLVIAQANTSTSGYLTSTDWTTFNGKQAALVSGTNIKTVNGTTLLGSGDLGTITYAYGGTGQTTVTIGDLLYGSATNVWSKLGIGSTGQILRVVSGAPAWGTDYTGTVTSVSGTGTVSGISLSGTVTSSGSLTLGGTLDLSSPPAIGGTAANTITGTTITATKFVGVSGGTF